MYAHGGIVAAAAAILKDMDQHNMLHRLLEEFDPYSLDTPHADDGYATWFANICISVYLLVDNVICRYHNQTRHPC